MSIFASLLALISCGSIRQQPQGRVVSYEYAEHGTVAQPLCQFKVELIDTATCRVSYFNHDAFENDTIDWMSEDAGIDTVMCEASLLDSIGQTIAEHKMWKYKERYEPLFEVLDGDSWGFTIKYSNGDEIGSGGSNAGPDDDGCGIIRQMMRKRFKGL